MSRYFWYWRPGWITTFSVFSPEKARKKYVTEACSEIFCVMGDGEHALHTDMDTRVGFYKKKSRLSRHKRRQKNLSFFRVSCCLDVANTFCEIFHSEKGIQWCKIKFFHTRFFLLLATPTSLCNSRFVVEYQNIFLGRSPSSCHVKIRGEKKWEECVTRC